LKEGLSSMGVFEFLSWGMTEYAKSLKSPTFRTIESRKERSKRKHMAPAKRILDDVLEDNHKRSP